MMQPACILIGRPEPAASRLADRARQAGLDSLVAPAFELAGPADPERTRARLLAMLPADWIVLPSPAAVSQTLQLVAIETLQPSRFLVPGPGTARAARAAGLEPVFAPASGFTTEAMLNLEALGDVAGKRVIICAAHGGRRALGQSLARRGARVDRIEVYRRLPLDLPDPVQARIPACRRLAIVASSGAILQQLIGNLEGAGQELPERTLWLVPSPRVESRAREQGLKRVRLVPGMDDQAVIDAALHA